MSHPRTDLVLLHGWGMNSAVWQALPDSLTQQRRLHPIDLPGHGGAPFDPAWRDLDAWADACLAQAPERAVWIGWSLGGLIALQAALKVARARVTRADAKRERRIAALVLITATPRFTQAVDWRPAMPEETLTGFHDNLLADPKVTLERFLALQVRGSDDARGTLRLLRTEIGARPEPDPAALTVGLNLLHDEDLRGPLADIGVPSLWLFGERDTLVPAAVAERVPMLLPGARAQVIAGAAHAPILSRPDATAGAIAQFLNEAGL
jgi:pimeloyl-[acyl-carrier protein] methyl ester esterase